MSKPSKHRLRDVLVVMLEGRADMLALAHSMAARGVGNESAVSFEVRVGREGEVLTVAASVAVTLGEIDQMPLAWVGLALHAVPERLAGDFLDPRDVPRAVDVAGFFSGAHRARGRDGVKLARRSLAIAA